MVKTAPHFGHLIFASLDTPAHPKEKSASSVNPKKILAHLFITYWSPFFNECESILLLGI